MYVVLLGSTARDRGWLVLEFCLMPNHVHLLVEISSPNLSEGLRDLHRSYVRRFNDRHGRSGRLFEHRPGWKAVEDEIYLLTVLQYIAHNPVEAALCTRPEEWRWSRRGLLRRRPCPEWLAGDQAIGELKEGTRFRL